VAEDNCLWIFIWELLHLGTSFPVLEVEQIDLIELSFKWKPHFVRSTNHMWLQMLDTYSATSVVSSHSKLLFILFTYKIHKLYE
jgi:hypothetical protein